MPAGKGFTVKGKEGNISLQKKKWIDLIAAYGNYSNPDFIHDFFGKMTREQIGIFCLQTYRSSLKTIWCIAGNVERLIKFDRESWDKPAEDAYFARENK